MSIGWHTERQGPTLKGRHTEDHHAIGNVIAATHARGHEPSVDFDWECLDDNAGELMERMREKGRPITREQAVEAIKWMDECGRNSEGVMRHIVRLIEWLGRGHPLMDDIRGDGSSHKSETKAEDRMGLRAIIMVRHILPNSRLGKIPAARIATAFRVSEYTVSALGKSFRKKIGIGK